MNPHAGAVDHLDIAIVSLSQRVHNPVPDAGLGPAAEAVVLGSSSARNAPAGPPAAPRAACSAKAVR